MKKTLAKFSLPSSTIEMSPKYRKKIHGLRQIDTRKFPGIDWISVGTVTAETDTSDYRLRRSGLKLVRIGNADHVHIHQYNVWVRRPDLPVPSIDDLKDKEPEPQHHRTEPERDLHV
jgi:hypothetical protein